MQHAGGMLLPVQKLVATIIFAFEWMHEYFLIPFRFFATIITDTFEGGVAYGA